MKVRYEFVNGDVSEVEVGVEWSNLLFAMDDTEAKNDRKNTRSDRHTSLSVFDYEGELFDAGVDVAEDALRRLDAEAVRRAMERLSHSQRELLHKVYYEGLSLVSIASEEGVDKSAIAHRLERIYRRLKKILH